MLTLTKPDPTPLGHLMLSTVGSPRRLLYAQNLARAGPVELRITAYHAMSTNDTPLAAAVCMRLETMKKKSRLEVGFTRSELASAMARNGDPV